MTSISFVANFQHSWLGLSWGGMARCKPRRVWLTILHDSPSKKLICVGNSEMPSRHSVRWFFFTFFLRDSKDYSDSPPSLRKGPTQTSEQHLMSVFSAGQPTDLGALVFFTIILKCQFCQKIASYPCQMSGWWGHVGPRQHRLWWGESLKGDHRGIVAVSKASSFVSASETPS